MPARGLLITGTDTGVGKTFVGCGLARTIRQRGVHIAPFKPAESGCVRDPESHELVPADALALRRAAQSAAALEDICPYRFEAPLAPWLAAEREGSQVNPSHLAECYQRLAATHELVLVETAGGILVPLTGTFHYGHLAHALQLPVLLVAGSRLGVINQTLLTLEFLRTFALRVIGCVLNHPYEEDSLAVETNAEALRRLTNVPLFVLPRSGNGGGRAAELIFEELAELCLAAL